MIPLLLAALAQADPLVPVHLDANVAVGMRMGAAVTATAEPVRHLEVGGTLLLTTPVYAGAPDWVRNGLQPAYNVHTSPMVAVGAHTGDTKVSGAFHLLAGIDVVTFRETSALAVLDAPVTYEAAEVVFSGGLLATLRVRPWEPERTSLRRVGLDLQVFVPLPPTATGVPDIGRLFAGLGLSLAWAPRG